MKKTILLLISILTLSTFSGIIKAHATSLFQGELYDLIFIDKNENLTISVPTKEISSNNVHYSYKIENNGETVSSRVAALHFGSVLYDFSKYEVTANDEIISPQIYYKNMSFQSPDYNNLLDNAFCEPAIYDDSLCGKYYTFTTVPNNSINITLDKNQKIIHNANNYSSNRGAEIKTTCTLTSSNTETHIFLTEGDLNYSCVGEYDVEVKTVSYNDFLIEMDFPLSDETILTTYLFISNAFDNFINCCNEILNFSDLFNLPNCMILVYDIELSSGVNTLSIDRPIIYFDNVYFPTDKPKNYPLIISIIFLVIFAVVEFFLIRKIIQSRRYGK